MGGGIEGLRGALWVYGRCGGIFRWFATPPEARSVVLKCPLFFVERRGGGYRPRCVMCVSRTDACAGHERAVHHNIVGGFSLRAVAGLADRQAVVVW